MNRIEAKFKEKQGQKILVSFITAGDPTLEASLSNALALDAGGVDIIELGMPFSDPMADGPVIQKASERALKHGTTLGDVIGLAKKIRQKSEIPLLLMGYYNPVYHYGLKSFVKDAKEAGVDALLIVDLPPEESADLKKLCDQYRLNLIFLLAPTSTVQRIKKVAKLASGFIYFVSMTGVTGASLNSDKALVSLIPKIKKICRLPVIVGFGIKTPAMVQKFSAYADGVVVGSAFVNVIEKFPPKKAAFALQMLATQMKKSIQK